MNRKTPSLTSLVLALVLSLSLCSCNTSENSGSSTNSQEAQEAYATYESVISADRIDVGSAYIQLSGLPLENAEALAFIDTLGQLVSCEGRYLQISESTGNTYTADISFYMSQGNVWCSIQYNGYRGTIADGQVSICSDGEYWFEVTPKGDLNGKEHEFTLRINDQNLYVTWATSEYTLVRDDGSAVVNEGSTPSSSDASTANVVYFDETANYSALVETIDEHYAGRDHSVFFDRETETLTIVLGAPSGSRNAILSGDPSVTDSWETVVDSGINLSGKLQDIGSGYYKHGDFIVVEDLKSDGTYKESNVLLTVHDGKVTYNCAADTSSNSSSSSSSSPSSSSSNPSSSNSSNSSNSHRETTGERNALQTAHSYLNVMAFSRQGLIEQLEYEGYTYSEAVYAVDHCGADWNEQAALTAQEYLNVMSFSRSDLIDQLEFEGFTHDQAVYGVNQVY